ncbi:MAG: hypothetical protein EL88_19805 [Phocaeicola dorei]|nr:MAG: hypothetical protein EL88_19805 [Phocaeicola dorei]
MEVKANMEAVVEFDLWFASLYNELRGRFGHFIDEDNFHNTYLFVRDKVMYSEERIGNFEAYFFRCYHYKEMTAMKQESRYTHPEDDFFLRFSDDEFSPSVKEIDRLERLVRDILRYLRDKFSTQEYRIFMLRYYGSPCSFRELSESMGISMNILLKKMERMMETIRTNSGFKHRCDMLYIYE